jgi:hypothetical protein
MSPAIRQLIVALHQAAGPYVLALTGGGASVAGHLLSVPGGSRSVLEILVPYHDRALAEFLGHSPSQSCSVETALAMARRAQERARWLAPGQRVTGFGVTASLASDRPKRGDHRFYIAAARADREATYSLTLTKGARDREAEEEVLATVLLNALAEEFGVTERLPLPLLNKEEVHAETRSTADLLLALLTGNLPALCVTPDGRWRTDAPTPSALLSGSFNPVHQGHWGLAEVATRRLGHPVAFELSVRNADKPSLEAEEVRRRLAPFTWRGTVWLTSAPTFEEKARLFPQCVFVVGADTAERVVSPRFYGDSETQMLASLQRIRAQGCRFLVAGRANAAGALRQCADLALPAAVADLFDGIPCEEFQSDLSSTRLRSGPHDSSA